jgi:uncharacterized protein (DUF924 family)
MTIDIKSAAEDILHFWLAEIPPEKRFARDDRIDAECTRRFKDVRDSLLANDARGWLDDRRTLLAAVIALDQFSRNIYRGSAEAFAGDALAQALARKAVDAGWNRDMIVAERIFLYMPFQHSEDIADQERSVALFDKLGDANARRFAHLHRDVIRHFGRFPGRNAALGRANTPAEVEFLKEDQAF